MPERDRDLLNGLVAEARTAGGTSYANRHAAGVTQPLYLRSVEKLARQNSEPLLASYSDLSSKRALAEEAEARIKSEYLEPDVRSWMLPFVFFGPGLLVYLLAAFVIQAFEQPVAVATFCLSIAAVAWVGLSMGRRTKWRQANAKAREEAATPIKERDLSQARFSRALEDTVLIPAYSDAIAVRWTTPDMPVEFRDDRALSSKIAGQGFVTTDASTRLALALLREQGTAIGIAGERGTGKTEMIRTVTRPGRRKIGVFVWAPTTIDSRAFLLHLLKILCVDVLNRSKELGGDDAREAYWHPGPTFGRGWLTYSTFRFVQGALILSGLALIAGNVLDFDLRESNLALGVLLIVVGLALRWAYFYFTRFLRGSEMAHEEQPQDVLLSIGRAYGEHRDPTRLAAALLRQAQFTESYSMNAELTARLSVVEGMIGRGEGLERQPMSDVDIVQAIANLVRAVRAKQHEVIIGIDELDKMATDDEAAAFLNSIKVLFPVEGCSFAISVSQNAWMRFDRRALEFRDVFDSSFDEVIYVEPMTYRESRDMLMTREPRMTDLAALFCFVLGGGLPRDVLRAARALAHAAATEATAALSAAGCLVVQQEYAAKTRSAAARISQLVDPSLRTEYLEMLDARKLFLNRTRSSWTCGAALVPWKEVSGGNDRQGALARGVVEENYHYAAFLELLVDAVLGDHVATVLSPGTGLDDPFIANFCSALASVRCRLSLDMSAASRELARLSQSLDEYCAAKS